MRGTGWCTEKAWGDLSLLHVEDIGVGVQWPMTSAGRGLRGFLAVPPLACVSTDKLFRPVLSIREGIEDVRLPYEAAVAHTHFLFLA